MGKGTGWAQAAADGINGYIRGMQIKQGMDDREDEKKWRDEQRTNARTDRQRADEERTTLINAGKPVEVQQDPGDADTASPGYLVGDKKYAPDQQADATAAAAAANTPEAITARTAAAYRGVGKPGEAQRIETEAVQGQAAKFTLDKAKKDMVNEEFDRKLATVTTPQQLQSILSGSPLAGGKEVTLSQTPDGKKFQLMVPGPDGTMVKMGQEFGGEAKDITKMLTTYSQSMNIGQKVTALQHFQTFEEQQRQFEESKRLQREQLAESTRHNKASEGVAAAHLGVAQQTLQFSKEKHADDLKNDPTRNLPGAVKLTVGGIDKSLAGIDAAITKAQAEGQWDPKSTGGKELLARQAQLQNKRIQVLKPYLGEAASDDYMGYGKTGTPGAAGGVAPPAIVPKTAAGKAVAAAPPGSWVNPAMASAGGVPTGAPGAPPAAQPAPAAADPLMTALGADSSSAGQIVAQKAPALRQAADAVRAAQAQVVQAAKSQNPQAVQQATQAAAAAGAQLKAMVQDMNPEQAAKVLAALGV